MGTTSSHYPTTSLGDEPLSAPMNNPPKYPSAMSTSYQHITPSSYMAMPANSHHPMHPLHKPSPPQLPPPHHGIKEPVVGNPEAWTIDQTIGNICHLDPALATHVETFRIHEIDGKALLLLSSEMMMKYLGMKLGPALKICNIIDKLKGKKHLPIG